MDRIDYKTLKERTERRIKELEIAIAQSKVDEARTPLSVLEHSYQINLYLLSLINEGRLLI